MAVNDAAKVPPEALLLVRPDSTIPFMRQWMGRLIGDGTLDRNTRTQIAANDAQLEDYVQRLLVMAAYRDAHIGNLRAAPGTLATVKGTIDAAVPVLLRLRSAATEGGTLVAETIAETLRRMADYQALYPTRKLQQILRLVAEQVEIGETPQMRQVRQMAAALETQVEILPANSRGERKIDVEETVRNMRDLMDRMERSMRQAQPGADIFGETRTASAVFDDFLRAVLGPKMDALAEDGPVYQADPRVARLRKLFKAAESRKLTVAEEREREQLERELGQQFMAFFGPELEGEGTAAQRAADRRELEARAAARLTAGPLTTQGDLLALPGQMTLFDPGLDYGYFPGFDAPLNLRRNEAEPRHNPRIEGPRAAGRHRGEQLLIAGVGGAGAGGRGGDAGAAGVAGTDAGGGGGGGGVAAGAAGRPGRTRGVTTARAHLLPKRSALEPRSHVSGLSADVGPFNLGILTPEQQDGVNRAVDAFRAGKNFGLFDGTGAGKTMQELALALVMARWTWAPALIVTERQGIIDEAFARDAEALRIPIHQYLGGPVAPGEIYLATYFDVAFGKVPRGVFPTIIFDEAHNLRGQGAATKAHEGNLLAGAAQYVLFATATPMDKPEQLWYLKSLLGQQTPEVALASIGVQTNVRRHARTGEPEHYFTLMPGFPDRTIEARLEHLFDGMYARGQAIKREVPLDNLDVRLVRIGLDTEALARLDAATARAEVEYAHLPRHVRAGLVLMAGRRELESNKAEHAVRRALEAVRQGRQVVLYAEAIEGGKFGGWQGLEAIATILERELGVGKVGRLYGGLATIGARRAQQQTLAAYMAGDIPVVVGTPKQAGTGLSLDDVRGDRPRTLILITPPFSALEWVQIAGRVNRLTTMSRAEMIVLITPTSVDRWNLGISIKKLRLLGAAAKGETAKLEPTETRLHESTQKYKSATQLEFDWQASVAGIGADGPGPGDGGSGGGLPAGRTPADQSAAGARVRVLASLIRQEALTSGVVNVVGKPCGTMAEAVVLARLFRDPRWEIFRWVFTREGKVVGTYALTARRPNMVYPMQAGRARGLRRPSPLRSPHRPA